MRILAAVLLFCLALPVAAAERSFGTPKMMLVNETEIKGRKVLRFEHDSIREWGYAKPQRDYLYVLPLAGNPDKKPLHVVLHSAGHSGDAVLADAFKHPDWFHYAGLDDQIVIYLDCRKNTNDWWWGAHAIRNGKGKYATQYSATEKRVLTSIEWAIKNYKVDRNRVYLSGISMGGSGSLGIGMCRGDIFAAVNVAVPAGVDHIKARMFEQQVPDHPILINFSAPNDGWCRGQEQLIAHFKTKKYPLIFAWGPHGHRSSVTPYHQAAVAFPWRSIRRDRAYPVFSNTSTNQTFPGFKNALKGDAVGQIGALFRWKNLKDTAATFEMDLRLVTADELKTSVAIPKATETDVSLRRLQQFKPEPEKSYAWKLTRAGETLQSGTLTADAHGLLTVTKLTISDQPARLEISTRR